MKMSDAFGEGEFLLPITLTEDEIQDKQAKYFINLNRIDEEDRKLAQAKEENKVVTEPFKAENKALRTQIHEGVEFKKVPAIEMPNEDKQTIEFICPTNGDVLYSRDMTPAEKRQYRARFGSFSEVPA